MTVSAIAFARHDPLRSHAAAAPSTKGIIGPYPKTMLSHGTSGRSATSMLRAECVTRLALRYRKLRSRRCNAVDLLVRTA